MLSSLGKGYFMIVCSLSAHLCAQLMKPIFYYLRTGKKDLRQVFASGGFPSSHSSTVAALTLSIGLIEGFNTTYFAISLIFSSIIWYDAMNVRYYAGRNIQITKQLIDDLQNSDVQLSKSPLYIMKMKDVLGHKEFEVIAGMFLGVLIALLFYFVF